MNIDTVGDELYGLRPDEFTPTRNERATEAREHGHKDLAKRIRGLRKPTAGAWVVNLLARQRSEQLEQLLQLGEQLRAAQGQLEGQQLRELSQRRSQVVSALAQEGQRLAREAGHPVSGSVGREVEGTLEAALADPDAASSVRSGRLTAALSYSGLGPVAASTVRDTRRDTRRDGRRDSATEAATEAAETGADTTGADAGAKAKTRTDRAEQSLRDAQERARQHQDERDRAEAHEAELRSRKEAADERVGEVQRELEDAREAARRAATELREATRGREKADRDLAAAQRGVERAQRHLDRSS